MVKPFLGLPFWLPFAFGLPKKGNFLAFIFILFPFYPFTQSKQVILAFSSTVTKF